MANAGTAIAINKNLVMISPFKRVVKHNVVLYRLKAPLPQAVKICRYFALAIGRILRCGVFAEMAIAASLAGGYSQNKETRPTFLGSRHLLSD